MRQLPHVLGQAITLGEVELSQIGQSGDAPGHVRVDPLQRKLPVRHVAFSIPYCSMGNLCYQLNIKRIYLNNMKGIVVAW